MVRLLFRFFKGNFNDFNAVAKELINTINDCTTSSLSSSSFNISINFLHFIAYRDLWPHDQTRSRVAAQSFGERKADEKV